MELSGTPGHGLLNVRKRTLAIETRTIHLPAPRSTVAQDPMANQLERRGQSEERGEGGGEEVGWYQNEHVPF